ncbi:hypothetical protein [Saccharibacillus alkalitolerans]|uniref:Uncharacterized protein n=1 Tax=Saccharibacillus alkalitolerans TaxID=2705290 RepID=A0ABX0F4D3_9BACL|nr:hypothetical protein [Saccharibacillus alkalitolerans]NGZ74859.1 hypothetical protein [Saccharibacillus alkalitolerans]
MKHRFARTAGRSIAAGLLTALLLLPAGNRAQAWEPFDNFVNGLEMFGQLPGEVNELRQGYEETVDQLNAAKADIQGYRDDMDAYKQQITQLNEQNVRLDEQNRQLQQTVAALNAAQKERERSARTMKFIIFILVGLFVGYFLLIRVLRLGLRGRR